MFEPLFRGKRADNGEWVEGILFKLIKSEIPLALDGGMNDFLGRKRIDKWKSKNRHKYLL